MHSCVVRLERLQYGLLMFCSLRVCEFSRCMFLARNLSFQRASLLADACSAHLAEDLPTLICQVLCREFANAVVKALFFSALLMAHTASACALQQD